MYIDMYVHVHGYVYVNKYVYVFVSLTISSVYISNKHVDFSSIPCLSNIQHLKSNTEGDTIRIIIKYTIENKNKTRIAIRDTTIVAEETAKK